MKVFAIEINRYTWIESTEGLHGSIDWQSLTNIAVTLGNIESINQMSSKG